MGLIQNASDKDRWQKLRQINGTYIWMQNQHWESSDKFKINICKQNKITFDFLWLFLFHVLLNQIFYCQLLLSLFYLLYLSIILDHDMIQTKIAGSLNPKINYQPQSNLQNHKYNIVANQIQQKHPQCRILPTKRKYLEQAHNLIIKQTLNQIIAHNLPYFRNIIQKNYHFKPNTHSLKIPAKKVSSNYAKDFLKTKPFDVHQASVDMKKNFFHITKNLSNSKLPLKSTYQVIFSQKKNQFKKVQQIHQKENMKKKNINKLFAQKNYHSNDAPYFLDTQNHLQYRNWGTGTIMPSMKPSITVVKTQVPFKAKSLYRTDFHSVKIPKTQIVTQQETFPQSINLWIRNSTYKENFNKKKNKRIEKGFKPIENSGATNLAFTSKTQYKKQFVNCKRVNFERSILKQTKSFTNEEILKLVLEL